ncbi:uncharacterized protein LOC131590295 isoform X2 [Poecile atricapillus]|uniref:uncharacterized protein LOC131590295 isoform X2 n=1 Tax=Poecile atricapillus TaxID=48891 RepID=UPI00273921B4|nr:uncharacterized protein LOC131590295 isoform X2 [Poecile atricapillus]
MDLGRVGNVGYSGIWRFLGFLMGSPCVFHGFFLPFLILYPLKMAMKRQKSHWCNTLGFGDWGCGIFQNSSLFLSIPPCVFHGFSLQFLILYPLKMAIKRQKSHWCSPVGIGDFRCGKPWNNGIFQVGNVGYSGIWSFLGFLMGSPCVFHGFSLQFLILYPLKMAMKRQKSHWCSPVGIGGVEYSRIPHFSLSIPPCVFHGFSLQFLIFYPLKMAIKRQKSHWCSPVGIGDFRCGIFQNSSLFSCQTPPSCVFHDFFPIFFLYPLKTTAKRQKSHWCSPVGIGDSRCRKHWNNRIFQNSSFFSVKFFFSLCFPHFFPSFILYPLKMARIPLVQRAEIWELEVWEALE